MSQCGLQRRRVEEYIRGLNGEWPDEVRYVGAVDISREHDMATDDAFVTDLERLRRRRLRPRHVDDVAGSVEAACLLIERPHIQTQIGQYRRHEGLEPGTEGCYLLSGQPE